MQHVLGPEIEDLGQATGVIQRRPKFTAITLLRMLVLALVKKPAAKATDFQTTAAQLGLHVTATAVEHRFTPQLVVSLRAVLERTVLLMLAAAPQATALPDDLARQFPGSGGTMRAGKAALNIHLLWDFLTGSILQLGIPPGCDCDVTNPIAQDVPPAGSLLLSDLGYFSLDRLRKLSRAGALGVSQLQPGTVVFDTAGRPLGLLQDLRQQTGAGPVDVSVLPGVTHRRPGRLIALRVPQEVANRRRQKAYQKAQKYGRVSSQEYLQWQNRTIFVANCEPGLLTRQAVVAIYRNAHPSLPQPLKDPIFLEYEP